MKFSVTRLSVGATALLILLLLGWWNWGTDPRAAFLSEVNAMIEKVNHGGHLDLTQKLSEEAKATITNNFVSVQQALFTARKLDTDKAIRYRLAQITVFYPGDYSEIEVERSGPGGDFSSPHRFPIPFIYKKGHWLVAGGFRGERDFSNPFE